MSAGELGTDTDTVETRLLDILELATMWNALLLIDEADIFMEKRSWLLVSLTFLPYSFCPFERLRDRVCGWMNEC
jgi:hypothetical protein